MWSQTEITFGIENITYIKRWWVNTVSLKTQSSAYQHTLLNACFSDILYMNPKQTFSCPGSTSIPTLGNSETQWLASATLEVQTTLATLTMTLWCQDSFAIFVFCVAEKTLQHTKMSHICKGKWQRLYTRIWGPHIRSTSKIVIFPQHIVSSEGREAKNVQMEQLPRWRALCGWWKWHLGHLRQLSY